MVETRRSILKTPIHIIVPVYRGITLTKRCLESLASSCLPLDCRITLIDDASPEAGMAEMLTTFIGSMGPPVNSNAGGHDKPRWDLLHNAVNLGFVSSVNLGMMRHPGHDVVLLNSDTEVPPGWLQRLRGAAYQRDDIGTVTPFSNYGSLASYPVPSVENALPHGFTTGKLDQLLQAANTGRLVDIPTGVGFCLFIRRDCLDDTGHFDEASFGKGYGEENDFCLRASKRGWSHVLAADCFVFHAGRASFGEEKEERVKRAYTMLTTLYPHYPALIQRHFSDDPIRSFRQRADILRLVQDDRGVRLVTGVASVDASSQALRENLDEPATSAPILQLSVSLAGHFELRWLNTGEALKLWFRLPEELNDLCKLLRALRVSDIHGRCYSDIPQLISRLVGNATQNRNWDLKAASQEELLDLVVRHGTPRFTGWQALIRSLHLLLATHGLRLSRSRLLRPLAALAPQALRTWIRRWIKASRA